MFTGIVEEIGKVTGLRRSASGQTLQIGGKLVASGVSLGDSVAVNGVCLTVSGFNGLSFTADVMQETLNRSGLGRLRLGSAVNLERAVAAGGRLGGHLVTGHIDGQGEILSVTPEGNAVWYAIGAPQYIMRYIIRKGSIAVDGISLTVADDNAGSFRVSVIPHTGQQTTLSQRRKGDLVNLENDCIGKYVEKLLGLSEWPQAQGGLRGIAQSLHSSETKGEGGQSSPSGETKQRIAQSSRFMETKRGISKSSHPQETKGSIAEMLAQWNA